MENLTEITLDLITVTDPSILRAIKHTRTQNYSEAALKKDEERDTPKNLKDSKLCIFSIGGKVFNADINDPISKIIMENRQSELYSISFTKGEDYTDSRNVVQQGINYSSKLTKKERQEDIAFQQDLKIEESRAELHILKEKAEIKMSAKQAMSMADLEEMA
jgi:LPS O-antigen subunit length determinant protein (WzzB/FepE family)